MATDDTVGGVFEIERASLLYAYSWLQMAEWALIGQPLEEGSELAPKFGADGLVTVVTRDAATGDVLMVIE